MVSDSRMSIYHISMTALFYWQGKMDAAANMIEKAIIANPTYAEAYNNLGCSLFL